MKDLKFFSFKEIHIVSVTLRRSSSSLTVSLPFLSSSLYFFSFLSSFCKRLWQSLIVLGRSWGRALALPHTSLICFLLFPSFPFLSFASTPDSQAQDSKELRQVRALAKREGFADLVGVDRVREGPGREGIVTMYEDRIEAEVAQGADMTWTDHDNGMGFDGEEEQEREGRGARQHGDTERPAAGNGGGAGNEAGSNEANESANDGVIQVGGTECKRNPPPR